MRTAGRPLALAACALGGIVVLTAASRSWVLIEARASIGLPGVTSRSSGADLVRVLPPLAFVGLAGVAALVATRGFLRRLVGLVLLLDGAAVVIAAAAGARRAPDIAGIVGTTERTGWPWVAVAGGLLLVGAGLVAAIGGGNWPALARRYEPPPAAAAGVPSAAGPAAAPPDGRWADTALWDAIDRGQDPTR